VVRSSPAPLLPLLFALACSGAARSPDDPVGDEPAPGAPLAPPPLVTLAPLASQAPASPVLGALQGELTRAWSELRKQKTKPYFLSYTAYEWDSVTIGARDGALEASEAERQRRLLIDLRIGDFAFDSTHPEKTERYDFRHQHGVYLPIDDEPMALRAAAWEGTNAAYRRAVQRFRRLEEMKKKGELASAAPDFSPEKPVIHREPPAVLEVDRAEWEERVRALSRRFRDGKVRGQVSFHARAGNRWLASSEGTRVQAGETLYEVFISTGEASAPFAAASAAGLPSMAHLEAAVDRVIADHQAWEAAPSAEAWHGPAVLEGSAAALFVHEMLGHRLEAQRVRDDLSSQVLVRLIGQPLMPAFLSVYDDPTVARLGTQWLPSYRVDDEGVPGRRVDLVKDGVLTGVLLSRTPAPGFSGSNGHGVRGRIGWLAPPAARQTNLVVQPARAVTREELRERLRAEARRQGRDHGLLVRQLQGRFQQPSEDSFRAEPARFGVEPVRLYRVFVDGRPDQLVRGASIKDPSAADLKWIMAAASDYQALTFRCSGDSGLVPSSAISPSLLFQRIDLVPAPGWK
jgi:predicted Zn-dependent protease